MASSQIINLTGAWQQVTLVNSWLNFGGSFQNLAVRRIASNLVEINGVLVRASAPASNSSLGSVPAGFRPATQISLFAQATGEISSRFDVATNGDILWLSGSPTAYFIVMGIYVA
jgi:hypothetical protein